MYYKSTRGAPSLLESAETVKQGLAPDGGLFVPTTIPKLNIDEIKQLIELDYKQRAIFILKLFLDDYSLDELIKCVNSAYSFDKFSDSQIAPLYSLNDNVSILELWHGPTCAFKDMALQLLPHLLVEALRKTGEKKKIVILVATSGDTGKAALEGFKDVEGTSIIVFYPNEGVSEIQKLQMVTQEGFNVSAIAVEGNFDDAQNGVKAMFSDIALNLKIEEYGYKFSSANSINWGRLVPQIVYYFSAYVDLVKAGSIDLGDKVNFVVPTGNFGDILAAYYAKKMGLPINKLICASNDNNVLTEFVITGTYNKNRAFKKTISPSMDILISSNLERLLYDMVNGNTEIVERWMQKLKEDGFYTVNSDMKKKISSIFWAGYSNEAETAKTIENIYNENKYLIDPHTAVAIDVYDKYAISTGDMLKTVIISTASPFKFNQSVAEAILPDFKINGKNEFELLELLSQESGMPIPEGLKELDKKKILHTRVCGKEGMKEQVMDILGMKE